MKFKKPVNENYCATVVSIKNIISFDNCNNIQGTTIFGNPIIVSKDVKVGDVGIYFPTETQLSDQYVMENNLYRHSERNKDVNKKGYIEDNRRIRTMKMRGNKSSGLFMPLESLSFCVNINELKVDDCFDEINDVKICNKYIVERRISQGGSNKKKSKKPKISKLIANQFRFHEDTNHFGKNAHRFSNNDIISITSKIHGTSVVISKLLCKQKFNILDNFLNFLRLKQNNLNITKFENGIIGVNSINVIYDNLYASRRVIKNDDMNEIYSHFYNIDVWGLANERLKEYLLDGMTIYAEIVGFLPNGGYIQKGYDYGCEPRTFEVYIYRITYTNISGDVFEFSAKQVQDWCKERGLKAVPELYYGEAYEIFEWKYDAYSEYYDSDLSFGDNLINTLREIYLERNCKICKNKVPAEGIVIRKETNNFEAYKFKSFAFLEYETKQLDQGEEDIEEEN